MSIYYECRLHKCVFDFSGNDLLYRSLVNGRKFDGLNIKEIITANHFKDDLIYNIVFNDITNVELDLCFGNKNKDGRIDKVLYLLGKYLISGNVVLWDEDSLRPIDIRKITTDEFGDICLYTSASSNKEDIVRCFADMGYYYSGILNDPIFLHLGLLKESNEEKRNTK